MKKMVLIVIMVVSTITFYGQDFAPVGAEWYYNEQFAFSGNINYIKFTSEKDTLIFGENCKKVTKRHKIICNDRPEVEYLFSRNDTVFFFDTIFNDFQILYDFNANANDSWIIKLKDEDHDIDTLTIKVDSVSTTQINGRDLKVLYVTYFKDDENSPETYTSSIIEKVGDLKYMFNWHPSSMVACDENYSSGLRCYQDYDFGLYSTGIADFCDYVYIWTGFDNLKPTGKIELFPNPANDFVEIKVKGCSEYTIELYDLNGRLQKLSSAFGSNFKLDLSDIASGVYVILLQNNDNQTIGYERLIKE